MLFRVQLCAELCLQLRLLLHLQLWHRRQSIPIARSRVSHGSQTRADVCRVPSVPIAAGHGTASICKAVTATSDRRVLSSCYSSSSASSSLNLLLQVLIAQHWQPSVSNTAAAAATGKSVPLLLLLLLLLTADSDYNVPLAEHSCIQNRGVKKSSTASQPLCGNTRSNLQQQVLVLSLSQRSCRENHSSSAKQTSCHLMSDAANYSAAWC
jgi:hypothetical protein